MTRNVLVAAMLRDRAVTEGDPCRRGQATAASLLTLMAASSDLGGTVQGDKCQNELDDFGNVKAREMVARCSLADAESENSRKL